MGGLSLFLTHSMSRWKGRMIMTETGELTTGQIADRYLAVWSEPDPAARRAAVAALWAPDGVEFIDGGIQFRGHDGLDTRVREAYEQFVATGAYALTSAGDVARHDDIVTFTVQLTTPDGEAAWQARIFLLVGRDGLIREDYQLTVKPLAA
jgi:SnoaL-like domain